MYTLSDERVMYVPPVVRTKLAELGIQPREQGIELGRGAILVRFSDPEEAQRKLMALARD